MRLCAARPIITALSVQYSLGGKYIFIFSFIPLAIDCFLNKELAQTPPPNTNVLSLYFLHAKNALLSNASIIAF